MSETTAKPEGHDQFTVADVANENAFHFDNRPDADDKLEKAQNAPGVEPKLFPPGESPAFLGEGESEDEPTEPLTDEVDVVEHVDPNDDERELIRTNVTYDRDGNPEMIEGVVEPDEHAPVFEMQGSTAVFLGPAFADRVETAADSVEQLPFVQAVDMEGKDG